MQKRNTSKVFPFEWGAFIHLQFKNNSSYTDFQWIQSVTTSEDEGCGNGPFNDPCADEGNSPFYHSKDDIKKGDNKEPGFDSRFNDRPSRAPIPGQTVTWNAELTLVGRNRSGVYEDLVTVKWGFTVQYTNGVPNSTNTPCMPVTPSVFQCGLIDQAKTK